MKDHKFRQTLFNRLGNYDDSLSELNYKLVTSDDDIILHSINYFIKSCPDLIYPAKSYAVAIIYAHLLEKEYADEFYSSLNDPQLFCGNDKYFVSYDEGRHIYDQILKKISYGPRFTLNLELPQVRKTVDYFRQEFSFSL